MTLSTPTCWAISDGAAGNENQAVALARALGFAPRVLRVRLRQPWAALAPRLTLGASAAIREERGEALAPPWPDLAIGCGRRAALVTRLLREWSARRCYAVQILDPRIDSAAFDLVVAPQHDGIDGDNVIRSIGALNTVDADWLAAGRARFSDFAQAPAPRTAVLIGGSNRAQRIDEAYLDALLDRLAARHADEGGSFLVSLSRRTPPALADKLRRAFAAFPGRFWSGDADGANPYAGYLGWADRIVVTPDSVNMISEACATGKPVYTFAPRAIEGKLAAFHAELAGSGHLRRLDDPLQGPPQPPPLAETAAIAELVRERWKAADAPRLASSADRTRGLSG
ncbi:mitochondrial fission ELM1 family protein [Dokdonella sp.]|uniref:mitochondrial fission ELM1 family protein n=1 Tax=Dokdonella sp. TaxID=2291710 RepID=UPI001B2DD38B|nr:mitochondrial fission ELM1 family protein [Dokdonella sp.]MBO9664330.1 mitochondrial fission ELM1 family protein [Dokdonella sp.]